MWGLFEFGPYGLVILLLPGASLQQIPGFFPLFPRCRGVLLPDRADDCQSGAAGEDQAGEAQHHNIAHNRIRNARRVHAKDGADQKHGGKG